MALARAHGAKVLLDGQGADEAWLGYARDALARLPETRWFGHPRYLSKAAKKSGLGGLQMLLYWMYFRTNRLAQTRNRRRMKRVGVCYNSLDALKQNSLTGSKGLGVRAIQLRNLEGTQLGQLLHYADSNSMAASIESRLPFLDHRLVELALNTPSSTKLHKGWSKYTPRVALSRVAPPEIAWRRRKLGFEPATNTFDPNSEALERSILKSDLLRDLGVRRFGGPHKDVTWRLFAIAQWEEVLGVRAGNAYA